MDVRGSESDGVGSGMASLRLTVWGAETSGSVGSVLERTCSERTCSNWAVST